MFNMLNKNALIPVQIIQTNFLSFYSKNKKGATPLIQSYTLLLKARYIKAYRAKKVYKVPYTNLIQPYTLFQKCV